LWRQIYSSFFQHPKEICSFVSETELQPYFSLFVICVRLGFVGIFCRIALFPSIRTECARDSDQSGTNRTERAHDSDQLEANRTERAHDSDQLGANWTEYAHDSDQLEANRTEYAHDSDQLEANRTEYARDSDQLEANWTEYAHDADQLEANRTKYAHDSEIYRNMRSAILAGIRNKNIRHENRFHAIKINKIWIHQEENFCRQPYHALPLHLLRRDWVARRFAKSVSR
jgi:hypothetical protein